MITIDDNRESRRFGPLPIDGMTPEQLVVAKAITDGPRAASTGLSGPFEALLQNPDLADCVQRVGERIRFRSSLPTALNELAILVTARHWTAQFEFHAHREMAANAGLDAAVADAIARGKQPILDPDGMAVYHFASQLLDAGSVSDEVWDAVAQRWGKLGAIDLIATVGYYCLISFVLNVDRYPVPDGRLPLTPAESAITG